MKKCISFAFLGALLISSSLAYAVVETEQKITSEAALQRLMQGNQRFVNDKLEHCDYTEVRRKATIEQQKPFAVVLGCADSRIPPEIVFDQSIGDIFVVRVAGNVVGPLELESIEYSVLVNDSVIIVVLGHENCGAVKAVLGNTIKDIKSIAQLIQPAITLAKTQKGDLLQNAVKDNVLAVVSQLQRTDVLSKFIKEGKIKVVGAYYNLSSGKVDLLQ